MDARDVGASRDRPRVIAELLRDREGASNGKDRSVARSQEVLPDGPGGALGDAVRDAAEGAQRGIEQGTLSGERAELVRRVFDRYRKRVGSPGATGTPAAIDPAQAAAQPRPQSPPSTPTAAPK